MTPNKLADLIKMEAIQMEEKSIWLEYISELEKFERGFNEDSLNEFEEWRRNIIDMLTPGQKIRFSKLKFYEPNTIEDIPF